MNVYSGDLFCEALASSYFPRQVVQSLYYTADRNTWKIPTINQQEKVTDFPIASTFIDFYESVENQSLAPSQSCHLSIDYIPRVSRGMISADLWNQEDLAQIYQPAPTICWDSVESWENFLSRHKKSFANSSRQQRKLEREVGTVQFTFDDRDRSVLERCMAMKSQQYRMSGEVDAFAQPEHVRFFEELARRGLLIVSSLRAGDRLVAAHMGIVSENRFYYWIPAYDRDYNRYSCGMLLLIALMKESFERDHDEFDFLIGDEPYKWLYATHTRLIGSVGQPPLAQRVVRSLKKVTKPILLDALNAAPSLKSRVKAIALRLGA